MRQVVHERSLELTDGKGTVYAHLLVWAEPQPGGTWQGSIEFFTSDRKGRVSTDRETTQSTLEGVAYWATGLQPTYLEGALERARRHSAGDKPEVEAQPLTAHGTAVRFRLITPDPEVPFQVMATRTLVPGSRRYIHNGGIIVYVGPAASGSTEPTAYDFLVQFGSENAAGMLANHLWSDLHGLGARLQVEGADVPIQNAAIKDALLGALVH